MNILSQDLKAIFTEATLAAFPDLDPNELLKWVTVEDPKNPDHGDYATSVAFKLAKKVGESPRSVAERIIEKVEKNYLIEELNFAEPGFINVKLKARLLQEILKEMEQGFGIQNFEVCSAPVLIDYSSTNAAKHMGVHHIVTTILGDSLSNLFDFMGTDVIRINHLGDWGTHFGKLIYALETWGDEKALHKSPNDELTRLYVKFHEEEEKHPELTDEARKIFKELEEGKPERVERWKWMVEESLKDLNKLFMRLGVGFDHITGESFYLKKAEEVIADGKESGVFVEGEGGSLIFSMGEGETPALVRKGDGTTLYLTRDIATVRYRVETWHPAYILYVVDTAQTLHFKQNFAAAHALGYAEKTELEHIVFGRMNFTDKAMSTRKGNVIRLSDLLDEAARRAGALAATRGTELPRAELSQLMELMGVASVKYGILSQDRQKDIIFDWDKIITLEGNSAPYLLYSYARALSITNKVGDISLSGLPILTLEAERLLIRKLIKMPDVLERSLHERKPHILCTYLYELCQEFNRFYGEVHVATADTQDQKRARLGLVRAFMHALRSGLSILGIPTVERM